MKFLKPSRLVAVVAVALLWTACKKEQSQSALQQSEPNQISSTARNSGLVADDPSRVSKIPLIMSTDFIAKGSGVTSFSIAPETSSLARGGKPRDVTPPDNVTFTSPTDGQAVSAAIITVSITASDNVGVASVSLSVNGAAPFKTLTSAPYNFSWDATQYASQSPTLTATAKDKAGNSRSTTITVNVDPSSGGGGGSGGSGGSGGGGTPPSSYDGMVTPPVGDQGNEFACVPFAVVYGARSIEEYYRHPTGGYSYATNIFSPEYVYDQVKVGDCGSGASITGCLDFMYNLGVTTWQTVPYSDANGCSIVPTGAQIAEATNYKIPNYSKVVSSDRSAIKSLVYANHPVIVSLNIDNNFTNATAGYTWNSISSGNAPHSVIIVGYDDSGSGAYKVMNSWGTSTWGDAGYLWISYSVFEARAGYYSYVMNY